MKISKARPTNYVEQVDLFALSVLRLIDSLIVMLSFGYLDCDMYSHYLFCTEFKIHDDLLPQERTLTDVYKSFWESLGEG